MFYKSKLWCVLMVLALMVGCEKKEHPIEIQTDSVSVPAVEKPPAIENSQSAPENFVEPESIEREGKPQEASILDESKEGTQVKLILKRPPLSRREERIEYVDWNVTELYFLKCSIIGVEGLEQLKSLETIVFDKCSDLQDFSFLSGVPHLKRLFVEYLIQNIDWGFIKGLPNLEVFYIDFYRQPIISIDLINNRNLEYIGFTSGVLEVFPTLNNVPNSLKYLNLEGNSITSLPSNFNLPIQTTILMGINPFVKDEKTPANVTVEFASRVIKEEKYRMPLRIPFISDARD